jgi:hypothetical protein
MIMESGTLASNPYVSALADLFFPQVWVPEYKAPR